VSIDGEVPSISIALRKIICANAFVLAQKTMRAKDEVLKVRRTRSMLVLDSALER